jgi:anti-sigma regulatory factor (Ser/Thr protein kinase)
VRPGGRGIFLIRKLMDQVEFNERGNSITMILLNQIEKPRKTSR